MEYSICVLDARSFTTLNNEVLLVTFNFYTLYPCTLKRVCAHELQLPLTEGIGIYDLILSITETTLSF